MLAGRILILRRVRKIDVVCKEGFAEIRKLLLTLMQMKMFLFPNQIPSVGRNSEDASHPINEVIENENIVRKKECVRSLRPPLLHGISSQLVKRLIFRKDDGSSVLLYEGVIR